MYLKQIELQGFKSFPDRTRLVFERGATVIVGPNGSGKSNISDAMRWVLGEISSKSLRGAKMEDIIFGGSDSRKPMGYAEVSVTFDNTEDENGRLECPYDEVTVTRRYYRNGDSEYFINRKAVRLRDIYELFLNTGVGRDGYSIIGQGRIAEIISRKSDERRGIFEDAAGIAKFRHRKTEAERKLEQTQGNMDRVQDSINIIGSNLAQLERDSIKARRFLEYSEIKRKADVQLWFYDTEKLRSGITGGENELRRTDMELDEATESVEALRAQQERLEQLSVENKAEGSRILERIRERTRENYELDSEIKVTTTRINHASTAAEADKSAALALRTAAEEEENAVKKKVDATFELAAEAQRLNEKITADKTEAEKIEKKADGLENAVADAFDEISDCRAELSDVMARLELLGRSGDEEKDRDEAARNNINERQRIADRHAAECSDSELSIAEFDAKLASNEAKLEVKRKNSADLHEKQERSRTEYTALNVKCDTLAGKIDALKRMEEHFEGYNNSVKYVMRTYREGRLTGTRARCGTIFGPVSSLITVDSKYVTAIETALGSAIQNIVVEDEETARAAIECLKRDSAGRATFFPLSSVRAAGNPTREMLDAARFEGYVGIASELVGTDSKFSSVISSMLGRIIVFDTLEHATAMAKAEKYSVRTVTLDGQQINRDGSFTGGSLRTGSGVLTRADEIKRMTAELETSRRAADKLQKELEELDLKIEEIDSIITSDESENKLLETLRAVEAAKLEKQRETLASDRELLDKFRADLESVAGEMEKRESEIASLEIREKELDEKITELEAYRTDREAERGDMLNRLDELNDIIHSTDLRLSEIRVEIENGNAMADLSRGKIASLKNDAKQKEESAAAAADEEKRLKEYLEDILSKHTAGAGELEDLNRQRAEAENGGLELERKIADIRRVSRDREARREELMGIKLRQETALAQVRTQLDALSQKFWDDYGLTRAEALEFNYPLITAEERPAVLAIQTEYAGKIRHIGSTDPASIERYTEEKEKYEHLVSQMEDLTNSKTELEKVIAKLEVEMRKAFSTCFDQINENFKRTFTELFGGGSAELVLTDPENVLESGIEIKAAPPGKIIKSLLQLSGGEQAFVAIALFFAILKVNPTPFCILDEIEAALDEVNVERFAQYIHKYSDGTQFILITHRRGTMNAADRLYGVTMPESGISKVLTLNIDDISNQKKGELWE
ncbi:MAG: chromosome segregation protein SMC [Clostridia bacterium]|nr:chromosome segregation protein SMC [Clostridia bacterium]